METEAKEVLFGIANQKLKDDFSVLVKKCERIEHGIKTQLRKDIGWSCVEWLVFMLVGAGISTLFFLKGEGEIGHIGGIVFAVLFGVGFTGGAIWNIICLCFAYGADIVDLEEFYRDMAKEIIANYTKEFLAIIGTYSETECKRQGERFDVETE